ncbi:GPI-GlcNAc transferase complex, PIG-H component-domain-containing protein [Scheffersomyces coipomensis]|uniref:GPI-GlcNAc transferase complex, PIG-H component-domain-containing protein n=1 Tax=Scheffersomyces coipomensis TaxID=1788519 RepID=UPI00315DA42F
MTFKDYELEITPKIDLDKTIKVESLNLLKFTIRNKRRSKIVTYRIHLILVLLGIFISYLFQHQSRLWEIGYAETYDMVQIMDSNRDILGYTGLFVISLMILLLRQECEDSLIIMKGIGIQLNSKRNWKWLFNNNKFDCFIPVNNIIDLVIHEGFYNYGQVIFYLCILTKTNQKQQNNSNTKVEFGSTGGISTTNSNDNLIKVVFPEFLPRKDILLQVWKLSRELLYGDVRRYWRRVPGQGLKQIS